MSALRLLFVAVTLIALSACAQPKPNQVLSDETLRQIQAYAPGITQECLQKLKYQGVQALRGSTDDCFEMMPPQRWRGLWRAEFEGSRFCPSPAQECGGGSSGERIWLSYGQTHSGPRLVDGSGLFQIEFIGRRTQRRGHYGHFGLSDHEVIVDRLISVQRAESAAAPSQKATTQS